MSDTANTMVFFSSRVHNIAPQDYVGDVGRMFYYPDSGTLRLSDGSTPGGLPINLTGNISDLAFGNFLFSNTTMTITTADADMTIEGNGTGNIDIMPGTQVNIGGALHVHTDGNLANVPYFDVATTGGTRILNPVINSTPGLAVIGNDSAESAIPAISGVMVQITGQQSLASVTLNDGVANRASFIGRRYNGTAASPSQVLDGEIIVRYGSSAYSDVGFPTASAGYIDIVAHGNQTSTNRGSNIEFWTTEVNTASATRAAYFNGHAFYANNVNTIGNVVIKATGNASNVGILQVTNNSSGNVRYPVLANVIAQFTGKDDKTPYIVFDGYGNVNSQATGGQFVFRTARGNLATPAAVQNNDPLGVVNAAGWGTTGYGGVAAAAIEFQAAGTFSDTSRPGKIVFKAIPSLSTTPTTALTITPTTAVWNNGMVMSNAWIQLPAGTSSQAPLQFTAGDLLTTSLTGAMNYDGKVFVGTPQDLERGIIPTQQQFVLDTTRNLTAGTTAAQSLWGKTVSLSANTRYYYEINALVAKNGSASNQPTINYGISPDTGSLTSHFYTVNSSVTATVGAVASGSQMFNYITTGFDTGVPITAAMPISTSYARVLIKGYIDVNTAATVDFQIAFSAAPNSSCSVQPKSGIYIYPVGPAGADTNVGTWA